MTYTMTYLDNVVVMQRIVIDAANGFKIDASAPSVLWSISISNLQREHLQPIVDQALLSVVPDFVPCCNYDILWTT